MTVKRKVSFVAAALCAVVLMVVPLTATAKKSAADDVTIIGATVDKPVREHFDMEEYMATMFAGGGPGDMEGGPGGAPGGMEGGPGGAPGGMEGGPGGAPGGMEGGPGGAPGGMEGGSGGPGGGGATSVPALYLDNGKYDASKSRTNVITAGDITDSYASGIKINATEGTVGGVYATGIGSEYVLADAEINLSGDGSGLGGLGSGAAADQWGTLVLRNVDITTNGLARAATSATNHSVLKVYNSNLVAHGVPFDQAKASPPAALEIEGNTRTHVTMSNSYSYFYYSTIEADGWAALSTDGAEGFVYLEANHCEVKTTKSGYGAYADGSCHTFFNTCDFDVACMAAILAGESDATFRNTTAKCGTYFALIHCVMGMPAEVSTLNVTGGEIDCKSPAVIVKSQNAIINFDGAKVTSEDGILVKSIVNDDPNATKTNGQKVYGIHATFKAMDVAGDIVHEDTDRDMWVYLDATTLSGAINNAIVTFTGASKWTATADSHVTIVGSVELDQIDAPAGVTITATAAKAGKYTLKSGGKLILRTS